MPCIDKIVAAMNQQMTPYIIEERQLNISQLDVF
jgi:ATP-dependent Clp protease protease subunit